VLLNFLSTRGFLVRGMSSLVVLRATDSNVYNGRNMSKIQSSSLVSVVSLANAAFRKLQQLVESSDSSVGSSRNVIDIDR
jgi:hypothetical protein